MKKTFIQNFTKIGFSNVLFIGLALFNNILITRWLGPEGRGVYAIVSNIVIFLNLFFGEGLRRSNTIMIGNNNAILSRLLLINFIYLFIIILISILIFFFKNSIIILVPNISSAIFLLALMISVFSIMWQAIQAIYLGLQKITFYNILLISSLAIMLVMNTLGIFVFQISILGILQNMLITNIITFTLGLFGFFKYYSFERIDRTYNLSSHIKLSFKSTISSLEIYSLHRGGLFFVNSIVDVSNAGFIAIAILFSDLIQKVPNIAGTLIFSKTAANCKNNNFQDIARVVRTVFFITFLVAIFINLFGEKIIFLMFGSEFLASFYPLRFMLIGIVFFSAGSVIYSYFMGIGFPNSTIVLNTIISILALISNYYLIKSLSLSGAGISYSIIFVLWALSFIYLFWKVSKIKIFDIIIIKKSDIMIIFRYLRNIFKMAQ